MKKCHIFYCILITLFIMGAQALFCQQMGDVDDNGVVDIVDALRVAQYAVGLPVQLSWSPSADVNCDGSITIVDALMIAQYAVGLISEFACMLPEPTAPPGPVHYTDEQVLAAVYSETYVCPYYFPVEDFPDELIYYQSTISIVPVDQRPDEQCQLGTDSYAQAAQWCEANEELSENLHSLQGERETDRFFEFTYINTYNGEDRIYLSRVHKLSYLDVTPYDFVEQGSFMGYLNVRPLTADSAQTAMEYLSLVFYLNKRWRKALDSYVTDEGTAYKVTLITARLVQGDWGLNDTIYLENTNFSVDKTTGAINRTVTPIRTITGEYNPYPVIP